jgi:phage FluMu protein Com
VDSTNHANKKMKPTSWRNCPSCNCNLVDAEISDALKHTCESGAFHSRLLGSRNPDTQEIEYWKCPDCKTVFTEFVKY